MSSSIHHLLFAAQQSIALALALPASEARIEAQALMRKALGNVSRAQLLMVDRETPSPVQAELFATLLQRRLAGEPVAYIEGCREFYGLEFKVTPDVLIPRPDTETLVEAALERIALQQPCCVLDLGTGSGAIAIAIAHSRPHAQVTAVDASPAALAVAGANAARLTSGNVRLLCSDWFAAVEGERFDVIVSNPPYINADDPHLQQGDLRFEPPAALASGADGLDAIREIVRVAPQHLAPGGWLLLEHGYDQAERVSALLLAGGFRDVESRRDLAGIQRVTLGSM
jgi:release factor glutamine methyltransferase